MSKKDLLERLSRTPVERPTVVRRAESSGPSTEDASEVKTTRVSAGVVRRRAVETTPERPVTTIRRQAVDVAAPAPTRRVEEAPPRVEVSRVEVEPEPVTQATPPPEATVTPAPAAAPEPEPRRAAEIAPEPVAARAEPEPQVERPEPVAERVEPPAAVAASEPGRAEQPVHREAEEPARAEPARPAATAGRPGAPVTRPTGHVVRPSAQVSRPATRADEPGAEGPRPDGPRSDQPRYAGLGVAVVRPPPGYDPTNPGAYRAQQERTAAGRAAPERTTRRRVDEGTAFRQPVAAPAEAPPADADARRRRPSGRRNAAPAGFDRQMKGRPGRKGGKKDLNRAASPGPKAQKRKIRVDNVISVAQLAHELGVKASVIIKKLIELGKMATVNEMLDVDSAMLIASDFDYEIENVGFQEKDFLQHVGEDEEAANLEGRPPVVTIMGHVDHGKTTLLDTIRKTRVAAGEAGGITQHIGAYQVVWKDTPITFLDTPGHEAFTAMRARGAGITDIVVLVVAADDGVQPQTEEAIAHAKAAGVPIIVAVNKMDKPGVNPDTIKQRMTEYDLVPEDWGGDTFFVPVSALKNQGIDELLESILLQAEMLDLHANADRHAEGVVIEAKMERGRGPVASVLVQNGTLRRGDIVVMGAVYGKVRALQDARGQTIKEAGPATPVEISGLSELPEVGDVVSVVATEKNARTLAEYRANEKRDTAMAVTRRRTAEDLFAQASGADTETLHLVLKADVQGSLQALKSAIDGLEVPGTVARIIHSGVGDISESDVNLVAANGGILLGFNVRVDAKARAAAEQQGVQAETFGVIYALLDSVKARMSGLLAPEYQQVKKATAEVRATFGISRVGTVAGSYITDGKVARSHVAHLLRDGKKIWEGRISGLKRFKEDVREVSAGYECGISLDGFNEIEVGDIIETYALEEVVRA